MAEFVEIVEIPTHGGRRDGAGRKRGHPLKAAASQETDKGAIRGEDATATAVLFAVSRARKESALADQAELKYRIDSGEYLSRAAFREAVATVLSEIAQAMRSLPDALERRHGLTPDVVQAVETTIDDVLATAASTLGMFVQETIEVSE